VTTLPDDEIQAKAARNLAVRAKAKLEAGRVVFDATKTATDKAINEAHKTRSRAETTYEGLQREAREANAEAEQRESVVKARQKRESDWAGGLNGVLARHYAGQNTAAAEPETYQDSINTLNAALRRAVS
jgi:hypothetical protein